MNQDEDTAVPDQGPPSPESDASTVSDPDSPPHGSERSELDEQRAAEELATIQEELQSVLEYVDQGMVLKSFDTLYRLTDIAVTNCDRLGTFFSLFVLSPSFPPSLLPILHFSPC
jgi:hypothetical protein